MRLDKIEIVDPDAIWPVSFLNQARRLKPVLEAHLSGPIEHIGSTAVPGLSAKPIIDMLAVVIDVDAVASSQDDLGKLSWVRDPEPRDEAEPRLSFCFPSRERRTHHLHVVHRSHPDWPGWIAFRDCLRRDSVLASEYEALKRDLAARFGADPNERDHYRTGKASFVRWVTLQELREQDD